MTYSLKQSIIHAEDKMLDLQPQYHEQQLQFDGQSQ